MRSIIENFDVSIIIGNILEFTLLFGQHVLVKRILLCSAIIRCILEVHTTLESPFGVIKTIDNLFISVI